MRCSNKKKHVPEKNEIRSQNAIHRGNNRRQYILCEVMTNYDKFKKKAQSTLQRREQQYTYIYIYIQIYTQLKSEHV